MSFLSFDVAVIFGKSMPKHNQVKNISLELFYLEFLFGIIQMKMCCFFGRPLHVEIALSGWPCLEGSPRQGSSGKGSPMINFQAMIGVPSRGLGLKVPMSVMILKKEVLLFLSRDFLCEIRERAAGYRWFDNEGARFSCEMLREFVRCRTFNWHSRWADASGIVTGRLFTLRNCEELQKTGSGFTGSHPTAR